MTLGQRLETLRPQFAAVAQKVYDGWIQDEDDDLNGGGICHLIAEEMAGVIHHNIPRANAGTVSAQIGEQHVWVVCYTRNEGYMVDIHPSTYERGGGYTWTKIPGVHFDSSDIIIHKMNPKDAQGSLEYEG